MQCNSVYAGIFLAFSSLSATQAAAESTAAAPTASGTTCVGFGPQTPRDIDNLAGSNKTQFSFAPSHTEMNLCNLHFHVNAEHKAQDFSILAKADEHGHGGGYQCAMGQSLTETELKAPEKNTCEGLKPGDTIEVHWVYTSCAVKPGKTLGACFSESCKSPNFRVESQVFLVVNDPSAMQFSHFNYEGAVINGYHQPNALPTTTGKPVEFLGSTTGTEFSSTQCSPYQVSWSVRPHCAKLDINSLNHWCEHNVFEEHHAHGVRPLVTEPALLSEIK